MSDLDTIIDGDDQDYEKPLSDEEFRFLVWKKRVEAAFNALTILNDLLALSPNGEYAESETTELRKWIDAEFAELITRGDVIPT